MLPDSLPRDDEPPVIRVARDKKNKRFFVNVHYTGGENSDPWEVSLIHDLKTDQFIDEPVDEQGLNFRFKEKEHTLTKGMFGCIKNKIDVSLCSPINCKMLELFEELLDKKHDKRDTPEFERALKVHLMEVKQEHRMEMLELFKSDRQGLMKLISEEQEGDKRRFMIWVLEYLCD